MFIKVITIFFVGGMFFFAGFQSVHAYSIKYINDANKKKIFATAYNDYQLYKKYSAAGKYSSALNALRSLGGHSPEMKLYAYRKMVRLLVSYFKADTIIKIAKKETSEFKKILFKQYLKKFLGKLAAHKISKKTAIEFHRVFSFTGSPQLKKVQLFFYKNGSPEHSRLLKAVWSSNLLPITRLKKPLFYTKRSIALLEKKAGYTEWLQRYTQKFADREYRYITKNAKKLLTRFRNAPVYPHELRYIYVKSLYKRKKYTLFVKELKTDTFGLMLDKHTDLISYLMSAYLRKDQYAMAEWLIQKMENTSIHRKHISGLKFTLGVHYFKNDPDRFNRIWELFNDVDRQHLNDQNRSDMDWYLLNVKLSKTDNRAGLMGEIKTMWENTNDTTYASGYCYWLQKIMYAHNISEKTNPTCVNRYTNYYYGMKSSIFRSKKTLFTACNPSLIRAFRGTEDNVILEWNAVLTAAGEKNAVHKLLRDGNRPVSLSLLSRLATLFENRDRYPDVQKLLSNHFKFWWNQSWTEHIKTCGFFYKLAYPKAYFRTVKKYARKYKVPENLVLSIMREESHFNSGAVSSSNAIGLMQLIPSTARFVAKKLRRRYSRRKLYAKDYNIRLGTFYIGNLLKRFSGDIDHSLAAYNGGPTNVRRWIKKNRPFDKDIFVELIPFKETRNYVKKVRRTHYLYNHIY